MRRYVAHASDILPAASASNDDSFKPISLEELSSSFSEEALREANVLPIPYSSLVEPLPAETSDKLLRTWQRDGVLVTPEPILTSSQRKTVKEAIVRSINSSLLKDLDPSLHVSFEDPDSLLLLTDSHCRTSKGIDQPDKIFFKGGNRRKPYLSKNTGMWNFYFIPEVMTIVQSNPDIHRVHALLMGSPHIKRDCFERIGIKPPGSVDMPRHLDTYLFDDNARPGHRLQSLCCIDVPEDVSARDSGTFEAVKGFHLYFALAREFFHPERGCGAYRLEPGPVPQRLPPKFDLTAFNVYIQLYTYLQNNASSYTSKKNKKKLKNEEKTKEEEEAEEEEEEETEELPAVFQNPFVRKGLDVTTLRSFWQHALSTFRRLSSSLVVPARARELRWEVVPMRPGSLLCWDSCIPHRNLRNKSKSRARVVAYCNAKLTEEPSWYLSEAFHLLKEGHKKLLGHASGQSSNDDNALEREMVRRSPGGQSTLFTVDGYYGHARQDNLLLKALFGFDFRTGETFTWEQYRSLTACREPPAATQVTTTTPKEQQTNTADEAQESRTANAEEDSRQHDEARNDGVHSGNLE
ncbi:hypothetical protein QOT17_007096 [Balamuthia mandrillaris]